MTTLDQLTNEQLDQLYDWLLDMPTKQVVEKVALPAPEGFGIKTHVTTLRRFKDRRWAELAADRIQTATQLAGITTNQHDTLDTGIQVAIKHHMFERASASNITNDQLTLVSRWSHRQEKLKLEIQRVQIARDRCAQNNLRLQLLARSRNLSFSGGTSSKSPTSTSRDAITPKNAIPAGQETQDTGASPSQSDIGNPKSEINFNPVHPVQLPGLETQSDIRDQKSDMLAPSPDFNSSLITHDSSLRECDHLGPLARNLGRRPPARPNKIRHHPRRIRPPRRTPPHLEKPQRLK